MAPRNLLPILCLSGALLAHGASGNASSNSAGDDFKTLKDMIEIQSKQIDVLAQEIARLNLLLEARTPSATGLAPIPATPPVKEETDTPVPKATAIAAPATSAGPVHIVAKGETLTAIAKRYKVTVPDLLKVNKITDVRKLQIGQTLALPPGAKLQDSPTPASPSP